MTNDLAAKLSEYGFPKPDGTRNSRLVAYYELEHGQIELTCMSTGVGEIHIFADVEVDHEPSSELAEYKRIKTDSDWRAVASFVRFLKGEK